jgi:hypothetical protein
MPFSVSFSLRSFSAVFFSSFYHCFSPLGVGSTELYLDQASHCGPFVLSGGSPAFLNCLTNLSIYFLVNNFKILITFLFSIGAAGSIKLGPELCLEAIFKVKKFLFFSKFRKFLAQKIQEF